MTGGIRPQARQGYALLYCEQKTQVLSSAALARHTKVWRLNRQSNLCDARISYSNELNGIQLKHTVEIKVLPKFKWTVHKTLTKQSWVNNVQHCFVFFTQRPSEARWGHWLSRRMSSRLSTCYTKLKNCSIF